jgi:hypothetical protein
LGYSRKYLHTPYRGAWNSRLFFTCKWVGNPDIFSVLKLPLYTLVQIFADFTVEGCGIPDIFKKKGFGIPDIFSVFEITPLYTVRNSRLFVKIIQYFMVADL